MTTGEFRCAFFVRDYEASVAFYRDGLGWPVTEEWDRGPDDRGTLVAAGAGFIELLATPRTRPANSPWDHRPPRGVMLVVAVDDADAVSRRAGDHGLQVVEDVKDQSWGHRSIVLADPDGVRLYLFTAT